MALQYIVYALELLTHFLVELKANVCGLTNALCVKGLGIFVSTCVG